MKCHLLILQERGLYVFFSLCGCNSTLDFFSRHTQTEESSKQQHLQDKLNYGKSLKQSWHNLGSWQESDNCPYGHWNIIRWLRVVLHFSNQDRNRYVPKNSRKLIYTLQNSKAWQPRMPYCPRYWHNYLCGLHPQPMCHQHPVTCMILLTYWRN